MKVKVGLIQMTCQKDKQSNIEKTIEKIKECASKGANIICLQELFASLYFWLYHLALPTTVDGKIVTFPAVAPLLPASLWTKASNPL